MLLALDESDKKQRIQCIGLVALPDDQVAKFESRFTQLRLTNKFWQELHWQQIRAGNRYAERYRPFIDLFFEFSACFYAWAYPTPTAQELDEHFDGNPGLVFHKYAYSLLASTDRKIGVSTKIRNPNLHIVYDTGTPASEEQIRQTRDILKPRSRVPIVHCCEADSKIISLLQIADILTGCAAAEVNNDFTSTGKRDLYNYVVEKNDGKKFFWGQPVMPFGHIKIDGFIVSH